MVTHTEITICNMALEHIGIGVKLASTDGTLANATTTTGEEYTECNFWYPKVRDLVLAAAPWGFSMKYATLSEADDGTSEVWTDHWDRAYTYPSDCLRFWRFIDDEGVGLSARYDSEGWLMLAPGGSYPYEVRNHDSSVVIMSNTPTDCAQVEYIYANTTVSNYPQSFSSLLSWRLAERIAAPLSVSAERVTRAQTEGIRMWQHALGQMMNEQQRRRPRAGPSISARGGD